MPPVCVVNHPRQRQQALIRNINPIFSNVSLMQCKKNSARLMIYHKRKLGVLTLELRRNDSRPICEGKNVNINDGQYRAEVVKERVRY